MRLIFIIIHCITGIIVQRSVANIAMLLNTTIIRQGTMVYSRKYRVTNTGRIISYLVTILNKNI